jgi:hypothetical protein
VKDDRGIYYYPFPENKQVRMYVRRETGEVAFRMWSSGDPQLWEDHGWVPYGAIRQAAALFKGKGFDPRRAYDMAVATALLKENPEV